jgi:orotate phosphoribosyltransferase
MLRAMGETKPYQERFIDLLAEHDVIRFGDFTLKSGRKSPYFINAGQLRTGRAIEGVGRAYAERIREAGLSPDVIFGPSYKGVPLAVATAIALAAEGRDVGFSFDRKEAKDHGEGGVFVGTQPAAGQSVVLVDDVITSGISIEQSAALLRNAAAVRILGAVVAVDRQEKGRERSTLEELETSLGAPVLPVTNVRQVVAYLSSTGKLRADQKAAIEDYLGLYGAS